MMNEISRAEAARRLGVSAPTVRKLIDLGKLDVSGSLKPLRSAVDELAAQKRTILVPGAAQEIAVACPTTSVELGGQMGLREQTDAIEEAHDALSAAGRLAELDTPGRFLTGAWEMAEERAEALGGERGVLLGVAGGYVFEVLRVIEYVTAIHYRNRKVFLVENADADTRAKYLGAVPALRQAPIQVRFEGPSV